MFPLRLRKKQIVSYKWLLFKSESVNVNFGKSLCSRIFWCSTLSLKRYLPVLMNCKSVLWSGALFSNTEIWIWFQSFFRVFSLIFNKKKVIEQLYHWAMTSIMQPVSTESYFCRTYVNIQPTERMNMFATEHSNDMVGGLERLN